MATIFWLSIYGVHICATWRIQLNRPYAAAIGLFVKLLRPLVRLYTPSASYISIYIKLLWPLVCLVTGCSVSVTKNYQKNVILPQERIGGYSSPFHSPWAGTSLDQEVRNSWPVPCQTYGYLPGCRASPLINQYQIVLVDERETRV